MSDNHVNGQKKKELNSNAKSKYIVMKDGTRYLAKGNITTFYKNVSKWEIEIIRDYNGEVYDKKYNNEKIGIRTKFQYGEDASNAKVFLCTPPIGPKYILNGNKTKWRTNVKNGKSYKIKWEEVNIEDININECIIYNGETFELPSQTKCKYCNTEVNIYHSNATRYHFDKCKHKIKEENDKN